MTQRPTPMLRSLLLTLLLLPAAATAIPIQSGISGSWYDPLRNLEGFLVEVLEPDVLVAYWYTYDGEGNQMWLAGAGPIEGETATVPVDVFEGGVFGPDYDPATVNRTAWGTLVFTFDSCDTGTVQYDSTIGFGSDTIALTRLTKVGGTSCAAEVPDLLGEYTLMDGSAEYFNCTNPAFDTVLASTSGTMTYDRQRGGDVFGTVELVGMTDTPMGQLTIVSSAMWEGFASGNEAVSVYGAADFTSTVNDQDDGGGSGTFAALFDDGTVRVQFFGSGTNGAGVTCSLDAEYTFVPATAQ